MILEWPEVEYEVPTGNILDGGPLFDLTAKNEGTTDLILEKFDTLVEVSDNRAM